MRGIGAGLVWLAAGVLLCLWALPVAASEPKLRTVVQRGHNAAVASLAFSPDGAYLASLSIDGELKYWSLSQNCLLRTANILDLLQTRADCPPDLSQKVDAIALGQIDGPLVVIQVGGRQFYFDPATGEVVKASAHFAYALAGNGRLAAYVDKAGAGSARIVAMRPGREESVFTIEPGFDPEGLHVSPGGEFASAHGRDIEGRWHVAVYKTETGALYREKVFFDPTIAPDKQVEFIPVAIDAAGEYLAGEFVNENRNAPSDSAARRCASRPAILVSEDWSCRNLIDAEEYDHAEFDSRGTLLANRPGFYFKAKCWRAPYDARPPRDGWMTAAAFSPDGARMAMAYGAEGGNTHTYPGFKLMVRERVADGMFDLGEEAAGFRLGTEEHWIETLAASPDGRLIAVSWQSLDERSRDVQGVACFDLATLSLRWRVQKAGDQSFGRIQEMAFTPDASSLLVKDHFTIEVLDAATGKLKAGWGYVHSRFDKGLAVDQAGTMAVFPETPGAGHPAEVRIESIAKNRPLPRIKPKSGPVRDVAISPDGRLAAIRVDREVRLYDLRSGRLRFKLREASLEGAENSPELVAFGFSRDGTRFICGKRIWLLPHPEPERILPDSAAILESAGQFDILRGGKLVAIPGGKTLSIGPGTSGVVLRETKTGKLVASLHVFADATVWVAADGSVRGDGAYERYVCKVNGMGCTIHRKGRL